MSRSLYGVVRVAALLGVVILVSIATSWPLGVAAGLATWLVMPIEHV